ncbi:MAG: hypothetical protein HY301_09800 [Verrucomicrobia bacterium]|nr:hypothetical protein [Verrucomicrobiota bacterium]
MKNIVRMIVCALLGVALGWYLGFTRLGMQSKREPGFHMSREETDASNAVLDGMHGILMTEAGDKTAAMTFFAKPIGYYYRTYGSKAGKNRERLEMRAEIERLASSNAVVAAEIGWKPK